MTDELAPPVVVAEVRILGQEAPLRATATVLIGRVDPSVQVDLDTGAQVNIVSLKFVRKHRLRPVAALVPHLIGANGAPIKCHGTYLLRVGMTDSEGVHREITHYFVCVRRPHDAPALLLSRESMGSEGIVIDTAASTWLFGRSSIVAPSNLIHEISDEEPVYVAYLQQLGLDLPTESTTHQEDDSPEEVDIDSLPSVLRPYIDVFSIKAALELPVLEGAQHSIDLTPGTQPPFGPLYPLSDTQLAELRRYLEENLRLGRILPSTSSAGAPILFVPKKDGTLRLCVDYRGLNRVTLKNRYPLPLIGELMDRLRGARWFSRIDLRDAYHRIGIKESDRWKTAFRTRYGHFEYAVMPFGLTNAPATFQAYMHQALAGFLDVFCIVYMDDILVFSSSEEEHATHLQQVFDRLRAHHLFVKHSKCSFFQDHIDFLGFIIGRDGITMDPSRVQAIQEWPEPESHRDVQVFLGLANFYRRFIAGYSRIVSPLTSLLKGSQNGVKTGPFLYGPTQRTAFAALKQAFQDATILRHWDPRRPTRVETDASNFAISAILSQLVDGQWRPIAYWSRKLTDAELRWATGQKELLAIVEGLEHWSHYLEGTDQRFLVLTDHQALKGVLNASARDLRGRLARWVYRLSQFDFDVQHQPGKTNPADPLSRRPDYTAGEITYGDVLPTLAEKLRLADLSSGELHAQVAALRFARGGNERVAPICQAEPEMACAVLSQRCC